MPTTPWSKNNDGCGPAWANSLFEDNAEFGLGMRVALDKQAEIARELLVKLSPQLDGQLVDALLNADQHDEAGIYEQRERVALLKSKLAAIKSDDAQRLSLTAESRR